MVSPVSKAVDADRLREFFKRGGIIHIFRIDGVRESESEWRLGQVSVFKSEPYFRLGWSFALSQTSCFRKEQFTAEDGNERAVAVFRQFDDKEHSKPASEMVAGWVEKEREADLDGWIAFMNGQIEDRLRQKKS